MRKVSNHSIIWTEQEYVAVVISDTQGTHALLPMTLSDVQTGWSAAGYESLCQIASQ
jgi:hypothetical protein